MDGGKKLCSLIHGWRKKIMFSNTWMEKKNIFPMNSWRKKKYKRKSKGKKLRKNTEIEEKKKKK